MDKMEAPAERHRFRAVFHCLVVVVIGSTVPAAYAC